MTVITDDRIIDYTKAAIETRVAFEAWEAAGKPYGQESIGHPAVERLQRAGERLNQIGGFDAMSAAQQGLYPDEAEVMAAGTYLNHVWNGIGDWRA